VSKEPSDQQIAEDFAAACLTGDVPRLEQCFNQAAREKVSLDLNAALETTFRWRHAEALSFLIQNGADPCVISDHQLDFYRAGVRHHDIIEIIEEAKEKLAPAAPSPERKTAPRDDVFEEEQTGTETRMAASGLRQQRS